MAVSIIFYFIFNIVYFLKNNYSPNFFFRRMGIGNCYSKAKTLYHTMNYIL
jgi:hypothetical protein